MAFHQIADLDAVAAGQPLGLLVGQRPGQELAALGVGAVGKTQNGQTALFRATARGGHVVEQQLFAQHGIDRVGQGGALARAKSAVFAEETGHHRVGGVVKFKGEPDQFGAGFQQGFRMHKPLLSSPPHFNHV